MSGLMGADAKIIKIDARITKLRDQIANLEAEIKELEQQRADRLDQMERDVNRNSD